MADINLEDLLNKRKSDSPALPAEVKPEAELAKVTQAVEILTPEEQAQVAKIKESIDLTDSTTALTFGNAAQKEVAEFANDILAATRTKDGGEVGMLLGELVNKVKGYNQEEKSFFRKLPLVGSLMDKADDIMTGYTKLATQVDRIQGELEKSKMRMMKDVVMFDGLYEKNVSYFKSLQLYIRAGEEKLQEMQAVTLPKLRQQAAASGDPMAVQVVKDFEDSVERFEKKVHDLKISKTIAIQTAPQIRLIQNNDKVLVDRVQTAIYNTIPLWKNQMVIALGLQRQQQVLQQQRAISDATNDLLRRNAALLKQNSVETARENERSIVDIDTVKKVNDDLISTIEETVKIQQEGRARRMAAEKELVAIEGRLKEVLMKERDRSNVR